MTTTHNVEPGTQPVTETRNRAARVGVLALTICLALAMVGASVPKLTGDPQLVAMFREIGGGDPLRWFVGAAEAAGAVGLLVPRLRRLAALGLVALLSGAAVTNVALLHESPVLPMVLGAAAGAVAWSTRGRR